MIMRRICFSKEKAGSSGAKKEPLVDGLSEKIGREIKKIGEGPLEEGISAGQRIFDFFGYDSSRYIAPMMDEEDAEIRLKAITILSLFSREDSNGLMIDALGDTNEIVAVAIKHLGFHGDESAIEALSELCSDPVAGIRDAADSAIDAIRKRAYDKKHEGHWETEGKSSKSLEELLGSDISNHDKLSALEEIVGINDGGAKGDSSAKQSAKDKLKTAIPFLLDVIHHSSSEGLVNRALELSEFVCNPSLKNGMINLIFSLDMEDEIIKEHENGSDYLSLYDRLTNCTDLLIRICGPSDIPAILGAMEAHVPGVEIGQAAMAASEIIMRISDQTTVPLMRKHIESGDPRFVLAAARTLGKLRDRESAGKIKELMESPNYSVAIMSIAAYSIILDREAGPDLLEQLKKPESSDWSIELITWLGLIGYSQAIPDIVHLLDDRPPEVTKAAINAIAAIGDYEQTIPYFFKENRTRSSRIVDAVQLMIDNCKSHEWISKFLVRWDDLTVHRHEIHESFVDGEIDARLYLIYGQAVNKELELRDGSQ